MRSICIPAIGLLLLTACGGGGGGGSGGQFTPVGWTAGVFQPESTFANKCAVPRTGIDPYTNMAYPDKAGTLLDENNFLRSWTNDLYLWFDEVTDQNPANFTTTLDYFDVLKTMLTTKSGAPEDKFHFTYKTSDWEALSQTGVQAGYGADWVVVAAEPPREIVIGFVEPGTPASGASLARGAEVLQVDGVDVVNDATQGGVDAINEGLFPSNLATSHQFVVHDFGAPAGQTRTVTLAPANIALPSVENVTTFSTAAGGTVGYMQFNDHLAAAEKELFDAFSQLQAAHVTDLVLDIRYNGGGYLDIASEVAYMIAGPAQTNGETFELTQFNSKHPTVDPVAGGAITPTPFYATTQGLPGSKIASGQALPTLNLTRVFVLTSKGTCSASESILNSLNGIGVQVVQIGTTTCGKPYGFYPQDNCGTTYFSIEFRGVNAMNFGDYSDGFSPQTNTPVPTNAVLPGCWVADDFGHALGNPAEGGLAAALTYIAAPGTCPTPASGFAKSLGVEQAATIGGIPIRAPASRALRILRPPR